MSAFDDRFKNHPVHQELEDVLTLLKGTKTPFKIIEIKESRERLERTLVHIGAVLASADPELTPLAVLDSIRGQIDPLRQQVQHSEDDEDPTYLDSANGYADTPPASFVL